MTKLLSCPFCGNDKIDLNHVTHLFFPDQFEIVCFEADCYASVAASSLDEAIARWNRRQIEPS